MWSRVLNAGEVRQLYRRGANRVKFQVRACATTTCNETTEPWIGPGGDLASYFSEYHNNDVLSALGVATGNVLSGWANLLFSSFTGLADPTERYFRYRAILESDDASTACDYGAGAAACSPELKSVEARP